MFGYFLLSVEIYIIIQVIFLLFFSIILQENILNLKYKFNVLNLVQYFSCIILLYAILVLYNIMNYEAILLNYQLICDNLSFFFKFVVLLMSFICILFTWNYCEYENIKLFEYLLLLLLSIVGILTIISSYDLITMYLAIELQSLCFYIVTNLKFYSNFSIEAGLKYFILGALSSGILLFGASLLYGFTGLTNFLDLTILFYYHTLEGYNLYYYEGALIGLIFIYCGILFKIGIVPFHMWVSDIYEGSPTNITFFFAIVPQISILSLLLRLNIIFIYAYLKYLYIFFIILSIFTIIVGTLGAIYQIKLKRILAYSGISNMGYILTAALTINIESIYSIIFYIIVYNMVTMGLWILLLSFRNQSNLIKLKEIGDIVLLFNSNKYISIIFFIFLFSAMGIPPMLGFFSKLFILLNIIELKMYFFALFIIILNSIGVIYYLRFIKIMYFSVSNKFLFLNNLSEIKALFLIFLIYLNIFFFFFPNSILKMIYTVKQFIKSGVHLGHYKWECDYRLSFFLLGIRNSIHIINLYYTLYILKQGLYIAYNICILNQRLLIANNVGFKLTTNFEKINQKKLTYINNKWIGGLLCNQRGIYLNNEKLFLKVYNLGYNSLLPSYVFASNIKQTSSCIFEAITLNIPCSTLLDSNIGYYGIFYGIPSNDDNFVTIYLFTRLFIKIYVKSIYDNIKNLNFIIKKKKK